MATINNPILIVIFVVVVVVVVAVDKPPRESIFYDYNDKNNNNKKRPIIGVLSQKTFDDDRKHGNSYLAASYVKYLESSGARVVPIKINQTQDYYEFMFDRLNGLLLPGGDQDELVSGYAKVARFFLLESEKAYRHGDRFPMWGTCLGFEEILTLVAGKSVLSSCEKTYNVARNVSFSSGFKKSRMFKNAPKELIHSLETNGVAAHFHYDCLYESTFNGNQRLSDFYRVLATDVDKNGTRYVTAVEGKRVPIYGVQWHPEKNPFEWHPESTAIVHTQAAYTASRYFADFFVSESRLNAHRFKSRSEEEPHLIYNYAPVYTGRLDGDDSHFEQAYYFNV